MKKKHIIFMMFLLIFFIGISNSKSFASFYIQNFEINSEVLNNGDMRVEEHITYYSTETKNGVTREIEIKNSNNSINSADNLILYNVKVDEVLSNQVKSGSIGNSGIYEYSVSGNKYKLKVYAPFKANQTKTITYEYLLKNVAVRYNDTSEIYWNFIGDEWDSKISNLTINIKLPVQAINGTTYVFGHGSDNGSFTKNGNNITLYAQDLSAYQALDARILFPTEALSETSKIVNKDVLKKYIDQEEGFSSKREEPKIVFGLSIKQIALMLSIIILLLWITIYFKYDKEISVKKQYYYRDIPFNLEPEILQRIYYGKKCKDSFWITFLNLVKMGVYRIEETTNEVGKKVKLIVYQGKEKNNLKEYQINLINTINGFFDKDENSIDIEKLNAKMKRSTGAGYKRFVDKLEEQIESYFGDSTKSPKMPFNISIVLLIIIILIIGIISLKINIEMATGIIMFLAITTLVYSIFFSTISWNLFTILFFAIHFSAFEVAIIAMMSTSGVGMLYIPYIISFIFVQYTQRIKKLSKEEREIREQIKGLRRYLRDYSKIGERNLESIIIWEDYLVIAIALGLNKKTINYFYDYCKDNLGNEFGTSLNSFGSYYYMNTICHQTFSNYANSYTHYVSSSSKSGNSYSGSRGGFSGGSSSGGRRRRRWRRKLLLKTVKRGKEGRSLKSLLEGIRGHSFKKSRDLENKLHNPSI